METINILDQIRRLFGGWDNGKFAFGDDQIEHAHKLQVFTREQLREYAKQLPPTHETGKMDDRYYRLILSGLKRNKNLLDRIHKEFVGALRDERNLLPTSTEWFIDNYYIVTDQILSVKSDLTLGFYRDLPKLSEGLFRGYPRIYAIALELLTHSDSRLDRDLISEFVLTYESVSPLTSAELWALPIMLRFVLIENLSRLMEKARDTFEKRKMASEYAERFVNLKSLFEGEIAGELGKMFRSNKSSDPVFLIWLLRGLRDRDSSVAMVIRWLELYVEQEDINVEEVVKAENQRHAAYRVSTGNIVTSMRLISSLDWTTLFEETSMVEKVLRQDPSGIYSKMDFLSRDTYRHAVENLSRYSRFNEQEVARRAIKLASSENTLNTHVGYYLIDRGIGELKANLSYAPAWNVALKEIVDRRATLVYLLAIAGFTILGVWGIAAYFGSFGIGWAWALLSVVVVSVPVVSVVNDIVVTFFQPTTPPKLEFKEGVPDEFLTVVVVPWVGGVEDVESVMVKMEKRFLANRDRNITFALLGDYPDSSLQTMPYDSDLLSKLKSATNDLNDKYKEEAEPFYLFMRDRKYNKQDQVWMGWERKRGKLEEFNRFLCEADLGGFSTIVGNIDRIKKNKFVITLDEDTLMPLNTAKKLIGAMAHPLNRPVFNKEGNRVVAGYGAIQPRVDVHAPSAIKTWFTKIFAAESGLDPYHSVVSNVYQDLFHNASYVGKAIYDVEAFYKCLDKRFPDNCLLSHDLLEGCYVRVALATDIELLENFPSSYESFSRRQHRWIRGDWQIIFWLLPWVKNGHGKLVKNVLGWQEKWKIFDNLRRSLVIPFGTVLLIFGWLMMPTITAGWTAFVFGLIFFPISQMVLEGLFRKMTGEGVKNYLVSVWDDLSLNFVRLVVSVANMANESFRNINAIALSGARMLFGAKGAMQWTSQAMDELHREMGVKSYVLMVTVLLTAVGALAIKGVEIVPVGVLTLWALSPIFDYLISRPIVIKNSVLSTDDQIGLMVTARRIWRFFDEFASVDNNFLPPDNLQVTPGPQVARRTSPTNIGFLLLSTVSAVDFGFIPQSELYERLQNIVTTLEKLHKHRGHLFNWYRTDTLAVMNPAYISTVDSGNLAACLITVAQACRDFIGKQDSLEKRLVGWKVAWRAWIEDWQRLAPKSPVIEKIVKAKAGCDGLSLEELEKLGKEIEDYEQDYGELAYWRKIVVQFDQTKTTLPIAAEQWSGLAARIDALVSSSDFKFLFDESKKVFSIGFNADENRLDDSYYNLLASEARLASFVAIAMGQVSERHWFDLGRPVKKVKGKTVLLSWGGTMFEYLMPELVMKSFENTLITQTNREVVDRHVDYAKAKFIPWGISESGFFAFDYNYNYQYQQFGVPDLSLKLELTENLVVAPYACLLALAFRASDVIANLNRLAKMGAYGTYGFYEAVDFNPDRVKKPKEWEVVLTYMSHHQGMSMVAIDNVLNDGIMQKRFHENGMVASAELLLSEKIPRRVSRVELPEKEFKAISRDPTLTDLTGYKFSGKTETIRTTVLSNSEYSVVVSNGGVGFSSWKNIDITRWQVDTVENNWGWFCFVKDLTSKEVWSATYQPFLKKPDKYEVAFLPHKAEFVRVDGQLETKTTVVVVSDGNVEIREVSITNRGKKTRGLEITDYAEIVGLKHRDDVFHPALGKLFVESEFDATRQALIFKRRPKSETDPERWIWHMMRMDGEKAPISEYETDRLGFLGRGRTILTASAFDNPLTNTVGATLDPIMSVRSRVFINPGETKRLFFLTGIEESKTLVDEMIGKYSEMGEMERAFKLSEIYSQIELRHLGIKPDEVRLFQKMGSRIIYPDRFSRAAQDILAQNVLGQTGLYPYGISGDFPIVLVKIKSRDGLRLIKQTLLAHEFLRMKNIYFDLIILNEQIPTYSGDLKEAIIGMIDTSLSRPRLDKPGGIFVRETATMPSGDRVLFETTARLVIDSQLGALEDAFDLALRTEERQYNFELDRKKLKTTGQAKYKLGDGSVNIISDYGDLTPIPWSNVITNSHFGTLVTGSGLGFTWANNSQQNRLTTWSNDPVSEKPGEVVYFKTDKGAGWWSATPLPSNGIGKYVIKHGFGYSEYLCKTDVATTVTEVWVDTDDPVKIINVKVTNTSGGVLRIKPTYYAELVLGDVREQNQFFTVTDFDNAHGAIVAKNSYNHVYGQNITFSMTTTPAVRYSTDRMEFLGRGGMWSQPVYMEADFETELEKRVGAGLDPVMVLETELELVAGEEKNVAFVLGQAKDKNEYQRLVQKYKNTANIGESLKRVKKSWKDRLGTIQITTPDKNLNTLANGWLVYQALAGRVWGRTGYFQSGGAFGFRDQLQDMLALLYCQPDLVRQHILYASGHQFIQGDVMHWWHPDTNRGVRTKISDDFLWLPWLVEKYVSVTSDTGILEEMVSFMDMAPLAETETERYDEAIPTHDKASVYTHCLRALENGMKVGIHKLPLIGSGDWNDGLNSVGEKGIGESVWLAWFEYGVFSDFAQICKIRGDKHNALRYLRYAKALKEAVAKTGWDGNWYKRAYFDDGSVLGSEENEECKIDSISQSWAVISNAETGSRAITALEAVDKQLVLEKDKLVLLLTPPFDKGTTFPGYIRGYIPGIRENGSQYTHAAVWLALAHAKLGNGSMALKLLDMINPINHTDSDTGVKTYKGEPYVLPGDVYSHAQHVGRMGWSWYTGSAAWMYKTIIEDILGLKQQGNKIIFTPVVPKNWDSFELKYVWKETTYDLKFKRSKEVKTIRPKSIRLINDKKKHVLRIAY